MKRTLVWQRRAAGILYRAGLWMVTVVGLTAMPASASCPGAGVYEIFRVDRTLENTHLVLDAFESKNGRAVVLRSRQHDDTQLWILKFTNYLLYVDDKGATTGRGPGWGCTLRQKSRVVHEREDGYLDSVRRFPLPAGYARTRLVTRQRDRRWPGRANGSGSGDPDTFEKLWVDSSQVWDFTPVMVDGKLEFLYIDGCLAVVYTIRQRRDYGYLDVAGDGDSQEKLLEGQVITRPFDLGGRWAMKREDCK